MGALDDAFASLVPTLLEAFSSTPAVFTRRNDTYDPATDTMTTSVVTANIITSPPEGYALQIINGSTIQSGDRMVTAGAEWGSLNVPRLGDEVVRGEMTGTIISISPMNAGDTVVGYDLQIRTP